DGGRLERLADGRLKRDVEAEPRDLLHQGVPAGEERIAPEEVAHGVRSIPRARKKNYFRSGGPAMVEVERREARSERAERGLALARHRGPPVPAAVGDPLLL